jgi:hypothetical protein
MMPPFLRRGAAIVMCLCIFCSGQRDACGPDMIQASRFEISVNDQHGALAIHEIVDDEHHSQAKALTEVLNGLIQSGEWSTRWVSYAPLLTIRTPNDDFFVVGTLLVWNPQDGRVRPEMVRELTSDEVTALREAAALIPP